MEKVIVFYDENEILSVSEYLGGEVLTIQSYIVDTKENVSIALNALGYDVTKVEEFNF